MSARFEPLDWLRGILALSIMFYHLTGWLMHSPGASEVLGRMGVYGVSSFFVLSGLSMAAAYKGSFTGFSSAIRFYVRRVFRIWPLLWIAIVTVTAGAWLLNRESPDPWVLLLNLTTLFGFVDPGAYINTGAWSIGNEMVYYAITPALLYLFERRVAYGNLLLLVVVIAGLYFGFCVLSKGSTLAEQWRPYINPVNNLYFYVAGVAVYYNLRAIEVKWFIPLLLIGAGAAIFALYPARGDLIETVTGVPRVVFSVASVLIVSGVFKMTYRPPRWLAEPLLRVGVATYGIYLLHPIVYSSMTAIVGRSLVLESPIASMTIVAAVTVLAALVLYRCVEEPMIRLGKKLTPIR